MHEDHHAARLIDPGSPGLITVAWIIIDIRHFGRSFEKWRQESAHFHFLPIEDTRASCTRPETDVRYVIARDRGEE